MKIRSLMLLIGFCLAGIAAAAQTQASGQAPTLADIARQKRAEKAKKVFTSEDMKAAEPTPEPAAAGEPATDAAPKPGVPQNDEAIAAAQAKVEDLRYREITLNKTLARMENSLAQARQEENEERVKTFTESIDQTKAAIADAAAQLKVAEQELMDMRAAKAAAAATAAAKKKAKPATKPKS